MGYDDCGFGKVVKRTMVLGREATDLPRLVLGCRVRSIWTLSPGERGVGPLKLDQPIQNERKEINKQCS